MVVDWPLAQQVSGAVPFLVSVWVDEPWKFALWGLGVAIDLLLLLVASGDDMLENAQQHAARLTRRALERMTAFEGISPVALQSGHLGERLGLFVIIALGEGVIQSVTAASGAEWGLGLLTTGLASFLLLVGMWALSVLHGYAGVPRLAGADVPRRLALALHCVGRLWDPRPVAHRSPGAHAPRGLGRWYLALVLLVHIWLERRRPDHPAQSS